MLIFFPDFTSANNDATNNYYVSHHISYGKTTSWNSDRHAAAICQECFIFDIAQKGFKFITEKEQCSQM